MSDSLFGTGGRQGCSRTVKGLGRQRGFLGGLSESSAALSAALKAYPEEGLQGCEET